MTLWQQWVHRPQTLWARKAFFQIHLWTGVAIALYVLVISVSGSAIVYRREFLTRPTVSASGRPRMGIEQVRQTAHRAYPDYDILSVVDPERSDRPDAVILEHREARISRLFDPYTGRDLGDPRSELDRMFRWLTDLHDNLLSGLTGRILNGFGAVLVTLVALTGIVVWWPGAKNWRRSVSINRRARFARFNWDLHSAVGFWCSLFVLIWGISGVCLCLPGSLTLHLSPEFRYWITRLHFGRFNSGTEALWTILGLSPAVLACTGALMWWNRVLRKKISAKKIGQNDRATAAAKINV